MKFLRKWCLVGVNCCGCGWFVRNGRFFGGQALLQRAQDLRILKIFILSYSILICYFYMLWSHEFILNELICIVCSNKNTF